MVKNPLDLIPTSVAARRAGVSQESIRRWIRVGALPYYRTCGGHYRVSAADLSQILAKYGDIGTEKQGN